MLTSTRRPGTVLSASLTCKPARGVLGFVMTCSACVILLWLFMQWAGKDDITTSDKQTAVGIVAAACVLFYLGSTWFFAFLTGHTRKLTIGEDGARYGTACFSWLEVAEIGVGTRRGGFQVRLVLNRGWPASRWLLTDDGMSQSMAWEFLEALESQILPQFPHLKIAKLLPSVADESGSLPSAETVS